MISLEQKKEKMISVIFVVKNQNGKIQGTRTEVDFKFRNDRLGERNNSAKNFQLKNRTY